MNEHAWRQQVQKIFSSPTNSLELGDDGTVLGNQCFKMATIVEGIHFSRDYFPLDAIGKKIITVALSDMAVASATATHCLLGIQLPNKLTDEDALEIMQGVADACAQHALQVIGGDTVKTDGPLSLTCCLLGSLSTNKTAPLKTIQTGDRLYCSGIPGRSYAGLLAFQQIKHSEKKFPRSCKAHLYPEAPLAFARILLDSGLVRSLTDVSDGISATCEKIAHACNHTIIVEMNNIPDDFERKAIAMELRMDEMEIALSGGEDFGVMVAVAPEHDEELLELLQQKTAEPCYLVGTVGVG